MALTTIPVELLTLDDGVTITVDDNSAALTIVSTDADNDTGPQLNLYRNSSSPADSDFLGRMQFIGRNDNSEDFVATDILTRIIDASDGTEDARLDINTMVAGTSRNRITVTESEAVMNEGSIDVDFRVESDGNTHMLVVDGANDRVFVKTSGTINNATLNVAGSIAFDGQTVGTYNDASGWIDFTSTSDQNKLRLHAGGDTGESSQIEISTVVSGSQSDAISVESGGTTVINQDSVNVRDFRVESDSLANMFVVDAGDNRVFIGKNANTSFDAYGSAIMMQLESASTSPYAGFGMVQNSNDADSAVLIFGKSRGTSVASTTIVQDDDVCGRIEFQGMDGGDLETCARIMGSVDGTPGTDDMPGRLTFATTADGANTPTERMRLNSNGVLMVNATSQIGSGGGTTAGLVVRGGGGGPHVAVLRNLDTSGGANQIEFQDGDGDVCGAINSNATNNTTSYGTSSDYRLKENVSAVSGAIDKLKLLEPKTYNFISNTEKTKEDGFLAHELAEVVPNAVTGEKDAVHPNGEINVQQVDYGKLTPLLTAALQEAIAKIETLEAEVAALKGE